MIKQVALALAFALPSVAAFAETPEERQACTDDAFRVCQQAVPDRDRVFACLVQNHTALSPLCRKALAPYIVADTPARSIGKAKAKGKSNDGKKAAKGPVDLNARAP
jgi:hypothetical protein